MISRLTVDKILKNGGKIYLVGGAVRDKLLGKKIHDYDYCITGMTKKNFEELLPEAKLVGKSFPVYLLEKNEIAFARKERKVFEGHKGFKVDFNPNITIEEDLKRRDFTINAMAVNLEDNKLIDPYNGRKDLQNKVIKATSKSFQEDPLRIYRATRFASQLDFKVYDDTLKMMRETKDKLDNLPEERVFEELKKALNTDSLYKFFYYLMIVNVLDVHFKEVDNLMFVPQSRAYHPECFVHSHFLQSLNVISDLTNKTCVRFAVMVHDIGKGITPIEEYPHHYEHHKLGLGVLDEFSNKFILPNKWYKAGRIAIREHMKVNNWQELRPGTLVKMFKKIKRSPLSISDFVDIIKADRLARSPNLYKSLGLNEIDFDYLSPIVELYYNLFNETGGKDIDSSRYSGKEFGEQLFQYRCQWIKREKNRLLT